MIFVSRAPKDTSNTHGTRGLEGTVGFLGRLRITIFNFRLGTSFGLGSSLWLSLGFGSSLGVARIVEPLAFISFVTFSLGIELTGRRVIIVTFVKY